MAVSAPSLRKHADPGRDGELTSFYLGFQNGMDRTKQYSIDVKVNGYAYTAYFGKSNLLPKDVVRVLQNSKSAIHPTPRVSEMDRMRGGEGRPAAQLMQSQQETQYVNDYEIVIEKEG